MGCLYVILILPYLILFVCIHIHTCIDVSLYQKESYDYEQQDINLSEIVSISRSCDRMLVSVEEYFRTEYTKRKGFSNYQDPVFQVTWTVCSI